MTKNNAALFQERVDELLLLEQRIDRRASTFIDIINEHTQNSQHAVSDLLDKVTHIDESLMHMNAASDQIRDYALQSKHHAHRTVTLFLGTVVTSLLIVAGTVWWSHHVVKSLARDRENLATLEYTLTHTPVIKEVDGKDYVRIRPGSETSVGHDDRALSGRYAEVWHMR
jgi:hypothetical protein